MQEPPWKVSRLEGNPPPTPFQTNNPGSKKALEGVKVLELCRIIAGPTVTRILSEYGADVLKITSPNLSDVPFFQVDGNMGKLAADLDLKTEEGRRQFEELVADADVLVDGYRPGALEKLGYGPNALASMAEKRGKGIVYVNENCFGYEGEWAGRPGWQQIADCVCYLPLKTVVWHTNETGYRRCLGTRTIHGFVQPCRPAISNLRLRHRLHGRHRSPNRPLPSRPNRRLLPRQSLPHALRPPPLRRGPILDRSPGANPRRTAAGVLPTPPLRQRRPHLVHRAEDHAAPLPASVRAGGPHREVALAGVQCGYRGRATGGRD